MNHTKYNGTSQMQINTGVSAETVDNYELLCLNITHETMAKVVSAACD